MQTLLPALALPALASCGGSGGSDAGRHTDTDPEPADPPPGGPAPDTPGQAVAVRAELLRDGLVEPWSLKFLPDGDALVTERRGAIRRLSRSGAADVLLQGVPAVFTEGQGGLLDLALGPSFATDQAVYLTLAQARGAGLAGTAVAKARLDGNRLVDVTVIFQQEPASAGGLHFGSRLAFAPDGLLYVTLGDRRVSEAAQSLASTRGKTIRIRADGSVPADNPAFAVAAPAGSHDADRGDAHPDFATGDALPPIWTYGHRNPQGIAVNPRDGSVWISEHGELGGDEINRLRRGRNYGWPRITWGVNYGSGTPLGEGTSAPDVEPPRFYWPAPGSSAPGGMTFYTGDRLPGWQGSLLVGLLAMQSLYRLDVDSDQVTASSRHLVSLGERIRDIEQAPDGYPWFITDSGRLYRLVPV